MRALLVLYLTQRYLLSDNRSFAIYGAYTALVYISPLMGGAIADRFFGYNKSVILGGALMIVGHFGFALQEFLLRRHRDRQKPVRLACKCSIYPWPS